MNAFIVIFNSSKGLFLAILSDSVVNFHSDFIKYNLDMALKASRRYQKFI